MSSDLPQLPRLPSLSTLPSHSALACSPLPAAAVAHSHRPCVWLFICLVSVNHPRGSNSNSGNGGCLASSIWGVACCMCLIEKSYATRIIMFIAIIWCKFAELKLNALDVSDAPVACLQSLPLPLPQPANGSNLTTLICYPHPHHTHTAQSACSYCCFWLLVHIKLHLKLHISTPTDYDR